jgi:hypothetical protein
MAFRLGTWSRDVAGGARWLYLAVVARVLSGREATLQNIHPVPSGGKPGWRQLFVIAFLSRCSSNKQLVSYCIMRSDTDGILAAYSVDNYTALERGNVLLQNLLEAR